jgi:NAD(P)-dependent dehydrogenase (short-subunit alcohol dehydrogenase family)
VSGPDDRPIVVTGGGSGMGRATALLLAGRGHPIVVVDIDGDGAARVEAEVRAHGGTALSAPADVSSRPELERAFARSADAFGPCWGLAAAAGVIDGASLEETSDDHITRQLGANLVGVVLSNQLAAAQMRRRGDGGRIVNWASDAGFGASPGFGLYAAAKSGVLSLTRTYAVELAPSGITVNALVPSVVETPMADHYSASEKAAIAALIPDGRWGTAEELAWFAGVLFADESAHMTGAALLVDGGLTAAMGRTRFVPAADRDAALSVR